MPAFEYEAVTPSGDKVNGILEADSEADTRQELRNMQLIPIEVKSVSNTVKREISFRGNVRISGEALAILTRQLATLLDSGLPLDDSLSAVAKQANKPVQKILSDLRSKIREGQSLASAMDAYKKTFSPIYRASIVAGETSGNLALVMNQLATYMEERSETGKKILLALIYPILLCTVSITVVIGLLVWVIPGLVDVITDAGQELPGLTLALINLSGFLLNYGGIILFFFLLSWILFGILMKYGGIKPKIDSFLLSTPLISTLLRDRASSSYTGTLGILTASGISLIESMQIAESTTSNHAINKKLVYITQQVRDGGALSQSMESSFLFNGMVIQLVSVGEKSGSLAAMLQRSARVQDDILQRRTATFVALFEPLTLLVMGAVIMAIVLAIMLPILNLNQLVQ